MCGIAGVVGSDDQALMKRMLDVIAHRGPDDSGIKSFSGRNGTEVVLGHRRLSIIDLSAQGHQPMCNEDSSLWVIFNGEIYNFAEIRDELQRAGHVFKSHSDTEIILHGYEEWGEDVIHRFVGMFTFCLYDIKTGNVTIARDRLGIKPLYYTQYKGMFAFASEIKSLLELPDFDRVMDVGSLDDYLSYGYVPGPATMFKGISKLQPGCIATIKNGNFKIRKYWELPPPSPESSSLDDQADELEIILTQAVNDRLVSDVPLGSFLSGGLDSSIVTALLARNLDSKHIPKTFCVGYQLEESRHDERGYAEIVAKHVNTDHHFIECKNDYAVNSLPRLVWNMDEPVSEDLLPPYAKLCEFAREEVTVILSGEGADEFLYGYRYYCLQKIQNKTRIAPDFLKRLAVNALDKKHDNLKYRALASVLTENEKELFIKWSTLNTNIDKVNMYGSAVSNIQKHTHLEQELDLLLEKGAHGGTDFSPSIDARYRMVDYILSRTDKLSMAVGLEVRVPFLDHRVVEYLSRVPVSNKIHGNEGKQVLRKVASKYLPEDIVWRRKKPFGSPVNEWLAELVKIYLEDSYLVQDGSLNAEFIRTISTSDYDVHGTQTRLWSVLILEIWYRIFIRQDEKTMSRVAI